MRFHQIIDDQNNQVVRLSEYDLHTIGAASDCLNKGDTRLSQHEFTAAAIVNGRIDLLANRDFRRALVEMGRTWAHATIEAIFDHWEREMVLPADHPQCPSGDQRIFTRHLS